MITVGESLAVGAEPREDGLEVLIEVYHADQEPDVLTTTGASRLEVHRHGSSGTIRFAKLAATTFGDEAPVLKRSDLEGSFEWTCPSAGANSPGPPGGAEWP
jgi:hypothetical protein